MFFNNTTYLCILYTLLSVIISILQQKNKKTTQLLKFLIKYVNNKPPGEYYK